MVYTECSPTVYVWVCLCVYGNTEWYTQSAVLQCVLAVTNAAISAFSGTSQLSSLTGFSLRIVAMEWKQLVLFSLVCSNETLHSFGHRPLFSIKLYLLPVHFQLIASISFSRSLFHLFFGLSVVLCSSGVQFSTCLAVRMSPRLPMCLFVLT